MCFLIATFVIPNLLATNFRQTLPVIPQLTPANEIKCSPEVFNFMTTRKDVEITTNISLTYNF